MATSTLRVAVVGAGIGGLSAAIALRRHGLHVDVYEQAAALGEVGVGMHLGSNGSRILHRWGLADRLSEVAVRPAALEVRTWQDGRVVNREPMGAAWAARFGSPYYTVRRTDLHRLLAEQVPAEHVHLDRRLVGFADDGRQVRLEFADGAATADVLVGADGIHSVVRQSLAAGGAAPTFSGTSAFRGVVPIAAVPGLPVETMFIWAGPDSRLLCYPVDGGRGLTFVAIVADPAWTLESWSAAGDPGDLVRLFEAWNPDAKAVVAAVGETRRWALCDREPLPAWTIGRATLLGDAAHPMLPHHGQGASQAIEDAVALGHLLATRPAAAALADYDALRRPHTTRVQLGSRGSGTLRVRPDSPDRAMTAMVDDVSWIQRYDIAEVLGACGSES
jgi:salicylate hydroxylase